MKQKVKNVIPKTWRNYWTSLRLWLIRLPYSYRKILRTTSPISRQFGYDRGTPIDRVYISQFIESERAFIRGVVLEIAEPTYTAKYTTQILRTEIMHVSKEHPGVSLIGDLCDYTSLPQNFVDCFILTQTLHVIYDYKAALRGAYKLLKPGGALLLTAPGISQVSRYDMDRWGDYWRFTPLSLKKVLVEVFNEADVSIDYFGNSYASACFIQGFCGEDLSARQLQKKDPDYPMLVVARAIKRH